MPMQQLQAKNKLVMDLWLPVSLVKEIWIESAKLLFKSVHSNNLQYLKSYSISSNGTPYTFIQRPLFIFKNLIAETFLLPADVLCQVWVGVVWNGANFLGPFLSPLCVIEIDRIYLNYSNVANHYFLF
jgi:hypothetical protein